MTDAPSAANAFAMLAPMPLDAPVTTATFPASFLLMSFAPQPVQPSAIKDAGRCRADSPYRVGSRIEPGVEVETVALTRTRSRRGASANARMITWGGAAASGGRHHAVISSDDS